ncbi:MAG: GFA family protein [Pseudomonadota bacterium]
MDRILSGHCLCGACRFELTGPHNWVGHCHCESCRRATASPFTTWIGQQNGAWRWSGAEPRLYASSAGVERGFCGTCGTPLMYRSDRFPEETHFYAALLTDPSDVTPTTRYFEEERLAWIHLEDRVQPG